MLKETVVAAGRGDSLEVAVSRIEVVVTRTEITRTEIKVVLRRTEIKVVGRVSEIKAVVPRSEITEIKVVVRRTEIDLAWTHESTERGGSQVKETTEIIPAAIPSIAWTIRFNATRRRGTCADHVPMRLAKNGMTRQSLPCLSHADFAKTKSFSGGKIGCVMSTRSMVHCRDIATHCSRSLH